MAVERLMTARATAVALLLGALAGCGGGPRIDVADAAKLELAPGEAVVLIERDGALDWTELVLMGDKGGRQVTLRLDGSGYALGVYRLPVGRYKATAVRLFDFRPTEFAEPIEFEVLAGKLNYFGELSFRRWNNGQGISHRIANRAGRLLTELRQRAPALVGRWPLVKVGEDSDDWTESAGPAR